MKNKFFLLAATLMLFAACEQIEDPRNKPVPDNPRIAWLLSIEMDQLPSNTSAYVCGVVNEVNGNVEFTAARNTINLPELLKIPGALWLKNNGQYAAGFVMVDSDLNIDTAVVEIPKLPIIHQNLNGDTINIEYPSKIKFDTLGVKGIFHLRYD